MEIVIWAFSKRVLRIGMLCSLVWQNNSQPTRMIASNIICYHARNYCLLNSLLLLFVCCSYMMLTLEIFFSSYVKLTQRILASYSYPPIQNNRHHHLLQVKSNSLNNNPLNNNDGDEQVYKSTCNNLLSLSAWKQLSAIYLAILHNQRF